MIRWLWLVYLDLWVDEIIVALKQGRVQDAFGAGTAATIAPIAKIGYKGELYELPSLESRELSIKIKSYLSDLKKGNIEDEMNWCVRVWFNFSEQLLFSFFLVYWVLHGYYLSKKLEFEYLHAY